MRALDADPHVAGSAPLDGLAATDHFVARGHHRFTIDPNVENERAIRAYAGAGFEPVGVMRAYERNPAGGWNDSLLMDLIVSDAEA